MDDNNIDGPSSSSPSTTSASLLSTLSEPLLTYASRAFLNDNVDDDNDDDARPAVDGQTATTSSSGDRLDELEISTRSRLIEIVDRLLSCNDDGVSHSADAIVAELMRYLKDVTLLCSLAAGHYSPSSPSSVVGTDGNPSSVSSLYPHPPTSLAAVKRLPFLLLEDAIDSLPLARVQTLWSGGGGGGGDDAHHPPHVSSYATSLLCSPTIFDNAQSKFALLRICNKVLRAIGTDRGGEGDAEFAGEIMLMLSKVFPLSERSAVNVLGTFHVGSVARFDDDGGGEGGVGHEFYAKFWGLQSVFADPHGTILPSRGREAAAAENCDAFFRDVSSVLAALESTPVLPGLMSSSAGGGDGAASGTARRHKYLTAQGLLPLQLKDARLRAHFLTQLLIVLSHLASPHVALPGGVAAAKRWNQLVQAETRATALLRSTTTSSVEGGSTRCLRWILRDRETMWRAWKRAKCMPALDTVGGVGAAAAGGTVVGGSAIRDALLGGRKRKADRAASADVDAGGDDDDGEDIRISTLPRITSLITESLPALETFLDPYVVALDPENGIEGEYHPRNDKVYCWRALRMLARDQGDRGGQLRRFSNLRRRDGDFEGIVRDMWREEARGDIGGSILDADYYAEDAGRRHGAVGGEDKAVDALEMMDDASVGTLEEETQSRLEKLAEFERAAMEVEEEMLYEDLDTVEVKLSTKDVGDAKIVGEGQKAENAITADAKSEEDTSSNGKMSIQDAAAETILLMTRGERAMGKAVEEEPEKPVLKDVSTVQSSKMIAQPAAAVNGESKSSPVVRNTGTTVSKANGDEVIHKGKTFVAWANKWSRSDEKTSASKETPKASYSSLNGKKDDHKNEDNATSSTPRAKFTPPQKVQDHQQQEVEPARDTSAGRYSWKRGSQADVRGRDGNEQQPLQQQPPHQQSRITPTHNQSKWDAAPSHNQRKWDGRDDGSKPAHHRGGATDSGKSRDAKSLSPALNSTNNLPSGNGNGNGNDVGVGPSHGGAAGAKGRGGWEPPPRGSGREGSHGRGAGRGYHERNNERSNNGRDRR